MAKIEGTYELTQFLRRYPLECNKIIRKALAASGRPIAAALRRKVPFSSWRKLVKTKTAQSRTSGRLYVVAGLFDNGHVSEHEQAKVNAGRKKNALREWHKAYFYNYGTLRRRWSGHEFREAPGGKKSRNKMGQRPHLFYEDAIAGLEARAYPQFVKTIERQHQRLIDKNAK